MGQDPEKQSKSSSTFGCLAKLEDKEIRNMAFKIVIVYMCRKRNFIKLYMKSLEPKNTVFVRWIQGRLETEKKKKERKRLGK